MEIAFYRLIISQAIFIEEWIVFNFCILGVYFFSILFIWSFMCGSQRENEYSRSGRPSVEDLLVLICY